MESKNSRILIQKEGQPCTIVIPSPQFLKKGGTVQLILDQVLKQNPDALVQVLDMKDLPKDRVFRNGWVLDGKTNKVIEDIDKCRGIHLNYIRNYREHEFKRLGFPHKLDTELEATVISSKTRQRLQDLRDIPQNIDLDNITSISDLKASWPNNLISDTPYK
jgi:hypothetical protein